MNFLRTLPQRLLWMFAGVGISHIVGIPFVGRIAASGLQLLSDGLQLASDGAESLSSYIRYEDAEEAHQIMALQIQQGAKVEQVYTYGDGSLGVRWNTADFAGDDIAVTTVSGISQETLDCLVADWI